MFLKTCLISNGYIVGSKSARLHLLKKSTIQCHFSHDFMSRQLCIFPPICVLGVSHGCNNSLLEASHPEPQSPHQENTQTGVLGADGPSGPLGCTGGADCPVLPRRSKRLAAILFVDDATHPLYATVVHPQSPTVYAGYFERDRIVDTGYAAQAFNRNSNRPRAMRRVKRHTLIQHAQLLNALCRAFSYCQAVPIHPAQRSAQKTRDLMPCWRACQRSCQMTGPNDRAKKKPTRKTRGFFKWDAPKNNGAA